MADEITAGQVLLAESDYLKSEQRQRIRFRDSLMYTTLAAMAGVVAAVLQARNTQLCLLLPLVTVVLGWKYAANDDKIAAIVHQPVFCWEAIRARSSRPARKAMKITVDLLVFGIAPAAALVTVWMTIECPPILLAVSILEAALAAVTSVFVATHAELATNKDAADTPLTIHESRCQHGISRDQKGRLP